MRIKTIASGSKGNCTIVLCNNINLIIDMGITFLTLKKSLEENSLSLTDFSGVLVTHSHSDHIKGLSSLIKNTNLKVYIPEAMYDSLKEYIPYAKCEFLEEISYLNDVKIELIHTSHDVPFSVGYIIEDNGKSFVYVTDTGYLNRKFLAKMVGKDAYLIESNHDEIMLMNGPYPRILKERVISDRGHLSNNTTAKYLKKIMGLNTKNVILAHLSENNNTEEKALEAMIKEGIDKQATITIARQHEEGPFIEV